MAANAEVTNEQQDTEKAHGIKHVWTNTVEQVQTRIKDVEHALKSSVEQVQTRFNQLRGEDGKKRLEELRESLKLEKLDELLHRFNLNKRAHDLVEEGVKLSEETIEKLGLAKIAEIDMVKTGIESVKETLDSLNKKLESVRKRQSDAISKKDFAELVDRVAALEKKVAGE
ncbi:MAG: hypothetical protein EP329_26995 [Deltaproteobacteria bacterium]|nr:MAG: hypothetical protein EP329_26995 [Deltaproteobacteria bacterium]